MFCFAACSTVDAPSLETRPGTSGTVKPEPEPDYSYVLADHSVRFQSDTLSLDYEQGGILYTINGSVHRLIQLESGINIAFNEADTSLTINGVNVLIEDGNVIGMEGGLKFYRLLPGPKFIVIETN